MTTNTMNRVRSYSGRQSQIQAIITAITNKTQRDTASTPAEAYFYQLRAAHRVNVFEPFTPDQTLLNTLLFELKAGKASCEYAWELFVGKRGFTN